MANQIEIYQQCHINLIQCIYIKKNKKVKLNMKVHFKKLKIQKFLKCLRLDFKMKIVVKKINLLDNKLKMIKMIKILKISVKLLDK